MKKIALPERPHWRDHAREVGFTFADMHGAPYWDESSAYRFSLAEVEDQIEAPATDLHAMTREAVATANALGVGPFETERVIEEIKQVLANARMGYTSIYADLQQGNRTEVDTIAGSVVAAAKEAGVPVPYHEMAVALVHAMEERKQWK